MSHDDDWWQLSKFYRWWITWMVAPEKKKVVSGTWFKKLLFQRSSVNKFSHSIHVNILSPLWRTDVTSCDYKLLCRLTKTSYQKCPKTSLHNGHYRTLYDPDSLKFNSASKAQVQHASRGVLAIWRRGSLCGGPADLLAEHKPNNTNMIFKKQ